MRETQPWIEMVEISYALARAETTLLIGDAAQVIEEPERVQTRAAAPVTSPQRRGAQGLGRDDAGIRKPG